MIKSFSILTITFLAEISSFSQNTFTLDQAISSSSDYKYVFVLGSARDHRSIAISISPTEQGLVLNNPYSEGTGFEFMNRERNKGISRELTPLDILAYLVDSKNTDISSLFIQEDSQVLGDIEAMFPFKITERLPIVEQYSLLNKYLFVLKINNRDNHMDWFVALGFSQEGASESLSLFSIGHYDPNAQRDILTPPPFFPGGIVEEEVYRSTNKTQQFALVYDRLYELATRLQGRSME